jgi:hypothetical protein
MAILKSISALIDVLAARNPNRMRNARNARNNVAICDTHLKRRLNGRTSIAVKGQINTIGAAPPSKTPVRAKMSLENMAMTTIAKPIAMSVRNQFQMTILNACELIKWSTIGSYEVASSFCSLSYGAEGSLQSRADVKSG